MPLPMSIGILEILKSKNSFFAHFWSKNDYLDLDDVKVSKFYNEYLVLYILSNICKVICKNMKGYVKILTHFSIEIWFFNIQNTFYLIVKGLKNAFFMPYSWLSK